MAEKPLVQLNDTEWIDLLINEHPPGKEIVIIVLGKLSRTLRIKKEDWSNCFSNFGGVDLKQGYEIEIVPVKDGVPNPMIPDWIRERLSSADTICITQKDGRYYLKKLELAEQPSEIPGCIVVDKFDNDRVERMYWSQTALDQITYDTIERLLSGMPKLRYDPVAPFKDMKGIWGVLGRKELLNGFTKEDKSFIEDYKKRICQDQLPDGSWEESAVHTAFNLIRLLEVDATIQDAPIEKAVNWLLKAREPLGFPGLFMFSEKTTDSFNAWKERQEIGSKKRGSREATPGQYKVFLDNSDILGTATSYCELKLTWTSAVAIEALLRCGLHNETRVVRAINTLLSKWQGRGWCGCDNFVADVSYEDSTEPVDFNRFPARIRDRHGNIVWLVEPDEILNLTCDSRYKGFAIGDKTLVAKSGDRGTGDCPLIVHKALSYHPTYHGSNIEISAAVEYVYRQGWLGDWTGNHISFFFSLLSQSVCPLSAFLVLRTIPLLIQQQRTDGFWQENKLPSPQKLVRVPSNEESTFMILKALRTFGFLQALVQGD
jgi:hypothetical protein